MAAINKLLAIIGAQKPQSIRLVRWLKQTPRQVSRPVNQSFCRKRFSVVPVEDDKPIERALDPERANTLQLWPIYKPESPHAWRVN